jgi:CubicO group peptidase (beta-lactamase class C family)
MTTAGSSETVVDQERLHARVAEGAERLAVPGVAVGVYHAGREQYAFQGVTSIENPLAVDERTLLQIGSTGKTYTAAGQTQ